MEYVQFRNGRRVTGYFKPLTFCPSKKKKKNTKGKKNTSPAYIQCPYCRLKYCILHFLEFFSTLYLSVFLFLGFSPLPGWDFKIHIISWIVFSNLATCGLEIIIADRFISYPLGLLAFKWSDWIGKDARLLNKTREVNTSLIVNILRKETTVNVLGCVWH